jgi:hypothetical protein
VPVVDDVPRPAGRWNFSASIRERSGFLGLRVSGGGSRPGPRIDFTDTGPKIMSTSAGSGSCRSRDRGHSPNLTPAAAAIGSVGYEAVELYRRTERKPKTSPMPTVQSSDWMTSEVVLCPANSCARCAGVTVPRVRSRTVLMMIVTG